MKKLIAVLLLATPLFAATLQPNPSQKQRALITELLALTGGNNVARQFIDAMFAQMEPESDGDAQAAERRAVMTRARTLIREKLDFSAIEEKQVLLYAKFFTEEDLAVMVAFYKSPTGRKTLQLVPQLLEESMKLGAELQPQVTALLQQAQDEHERSMPWRGTMKDLRAIGNALEAWSTDHGDVYPRAASWEALARELSPAYIKTLPQADVWGNPYAYSVSSDARQYRVVSAGADRNFEFDSRIVKPVPEGTETKYVESFDADIIWGDFMFLQAPVVAKHDDEDDDR